MKILKEFRDFLMKGNIIDIAIAIIMGGAFQKVIESLVKDVISPVIGLFIAQPDFSNLLIGPVKIGSFIITLISFLLTGLVIFLFIVKTRKKLEEFRGKRGLEIDPKESVETKEVELLRAILEELKKK